MTIGVGGLVSGLDTESIISQMMTLERRPVLLLQGRETDYQAKISALGIMKGGLAALQTAASSLADADGFVSFNATSGNTSVMTALASADAAAGNYQVEVAALATAQQVRSAAFTVAASTENVGTGVLTIQVGENTAFDVTIDADHQTLAGIATAINAAGTDVSAAVVDDGKGNVYLTLASSETGAANTINLTVVEDTGTLSTLEPLVETQAAGNAKLTLNGIDVERASNTITDLIGGVTLTLLDTDPGNPFKVTVDQNFSTITSKVQSFVAKYNAMVSTFDSLLSYNPEVGTGGILQGDSTTRQLRSGLQNLLYAKVDGVASDVNGLNRLGIQVGRDGKLSVDSETLTTVVEENPDQVINFFSNDEAGNDGIGRRFDDLLEGYLHRSTGLLDSKTAGLQTSIDDLGNQVDQIEYRLSIREANLRRQFQNLETLLAGFQATQGALDRQLQSLDGLNASIYGK